MKVYVPEIVVELRNFYGNYLYDINSYSSIQEHLGAIAQRMYEGIKQNLPFIKTEISNYHKDFLGKKELIDPNLFSLIDCQQTIANEYGYQNWEEVNQYSKINYNNIFENAVNLMLEGNLIALKNLIEENPNLLTLKSKYGHEATLLNYAASNGVEFWRQQVPMNLPEIVSYLIEVGVDKSATMKVYGGNYNTYELLITSIHPLKAGILEEMKVLLKP